MCFVTMNEQGKAAFRKKQTVHCTVCFYNACPIKFTDFIYKTSPIEQDEK